MISILVSCQLFVNCNEAGGLHTTELLGDVRAAFLPILADFFVFYYYFIFLR